jgi:hypothetical protein
MTNTLKAGKAELKAVCAIDARFTLYHAWLYLERKPWEPIARWQADKDARIILYRLLTNLEMERA